MPQALLEKYSEMLRLRELAARADAPDPRADMAALARRFPGALRELDERPLPEIRQRVAVLRAAIDGAGPVPAWAPLQSGYHGAMRALLRLRPRLRGLTVVQARQLVSTHYVPEAPDEPPVAALLGPVLPQLVMPPRGRLNPVAFDLAAQVLGVEADDIARALFKSCH